jgi:hypothetical protein
MPVPSSRCSSRSRCSTCCLDRDVERGGGLVGDQQPGAVGQRQRDHHALLHAAAELVRVLVDAALRIGDPDLAQQRDRLLARLAPRRRAVDREHLGHLRPDGQHRVERGHRLLEHHRHLAPAQRAALARRQRQQVDAAQPDRAGLDARRLGQQPHHRQRRDTLAAAGFPGHAHHLAALHAQAHPVDRAHRTARRAERGDEAVDLEQGRLGHGVAACGLVAVWNRRAGAAPDQACESGRHRCSVPAG